MNYNCRTDKGKSNRPPGPCTATGGRSCTQTGTENTSKPLIYFLGLVMMLSDAWIQLDRFVWLLLTPEVLLQAESRGSSRLNWDLL